MVRYKAVWDDALGLPLNGDVPVVLTKERFACDWRSTDGSVVCYSTNSADGVYYVGNVLEPTQRATGTFAHPVPNTEYRVEFRRHAPTKKEPWIRMEYVRWESATEVQGADELCDILLLPLNALKGGAKKKPKKQLKPKKSATRPKRG